MCTFSRNVHFTLLLKNRIHNTSRIPIHFFAQKLCQVYVVIVNKFDSLPIKSAQTKVRIVVNDKKKQEKKKTLLSRHLGSGISPESETQKYNVKSETPRV